MKPGDRMMWHPSDGGAPREVTIAGVDHGRICFRVDGKESEHWDYRCCFQPMPGLKVGDTALWTPTFTHPASPGPVEVEVRKIGDTYTVAVWYDAPDGNNRVCDACRAFSPTTCVNNKPSVRLTKRDKAKIDRLNQNDTKATLKKYRELYFNLVELQSLDYAYPITTAEI